MNLSKVQYLSLKYVIIIFFFNLNVFFIFINNQYN